MTASKLRGITHVVVGKLGTQWWAAPNFGERLPVRHLAVLLEHCDRLGITVVADYSVRKTMLSTVSWHGWNAYVPVEAGNGHHQGA